MGRTLRANYPTADLLGERRQGKQTKERQDRSHRPMSPIGLGADLQRQKFLKGCALSSLYLTVCLMSL
jgi:hypothetical protein